MRARAAEALPPDFAAGVIRAAARERRQRQVRNMAFGGVAVMLCVAYGLLALARIETGHKREALWLQYQQGQWIALRTL
ncbi:hypothetical protein [Verrucomicrobium sp. GAS474]|uniref:hypothetical protein n=1 Tax=Verrucomicrobium sp. GAS474 TaxID=1882831 RepID=UPI000B858D46|nr:hypothetical protein [Verrucomicrobium sp. GAS474]